MSDWFSRYRADLQNILGPPCPNCTTAPVDPNSPNMLPTPLGYMEVGTKEFDDAVFKSDWGVFWPVVKAWEQVKSGAYYVSDVLTQKRNTVPVVYVAGAAAYAVNRIRPKWTENLRSYQGQCRGGELSTAAGCEDPRAILFQCGDLPIWGDYRRHIFYCSEQPYSSDHNDYTAEIRQLIANLDREATDAAVVAGAVTQTRNVQLSEMQDKEWVKQFAQAQTQQILQTAHQAAEQGTQRVQRLAGQVAELEKQRGTAVTPDVAVKLTEQIGARRQEIANVTNQITSQLNQQAAQLTALAGNVVARVTAIETRSDVALSKISTSVPLVERRGGTVTIRRRGKSVRLALPAKRKRKRIVKRKKVVIKKRKN